MYQIGRYEVEREIGRGAMGVVYVGVDPKLKRRVAIKTVLPALASPDQPWEMLVKRLEREAQAAAALSHPNIIGVYDIVQADGMFCVVMEFVDGQSMADVVPLGDRYSTESTVRVLRECAAGLDHAHARGVIHRDIKPGNIMLDRFGGAKIADFGIAKLLHSSTDMTRGFAIGTLEYMSPEQINAMPVDGRTDQYALAATAYRLLTGSKIYDADSMGAWCYLVMNQAPTPATKRNPDLPSGVDAVLERGMAKKAEERYQTCSLFVEALAGALAPPPAAAKPSTLPMPPARPDAPSASAPIFGESPRPTPHFKMQLVVFAGLPGLAAVAAIVFFSNRHSTLKPAPIPVVTESPAQIAPQTSAPAGASKSPLQPPTPQPGTAPRPPAVAAVPSKSGSEKPAAPVRPTDQPPTVEPPGVATDKPPAVAPAETTPANPINAYRIGNGVSAPSILVKVEPVYDEEARKAKLEGTVVLSFVVDETGAAKGIKVTKSLSLALDQKAIEAVMKWRFKPGMKDGKAVPVIASVEVNFRLL